MRGRLSSLALLPLWRRPTEAQTPRVAVPCRSRLCLLRANGQIVGSDGEERDPADAHLLVLARELCRFHLFAALAGASRARTEEAADIYCESQSPFETCDSLKLRTPRGVGIWSWDRARVQGLIGGRSIYYQGRILPESHIYPAGDGWQQRADIDGFEAQYWEEGFLLASMWRRCPFEPEQWRQFTSDVAAPAIPPPLSPPEPKILALPTSIGATPARVRPRWGRAELGRASLALSLVAILFGSYQYGQALQYERLAAADTITLESTIARGNADPLTAATLNDLAMTRAFADMEGGNTPLSASAEAFTLLARYGFTVAEWRVDDLAFQARISPVPDLALVHDVASVMEGHPSFANVSARTDRAGDMLIFEAELEGARSVRPAAAAAEATP